VQLLFVTPLQVTEFADGGELFDHCVNVGGNGPMPEKGLQLAARQILRGLAHAHLRGLLHLDLKMENILLKEPVTRDDWKEAQDTPNAAVQLKIMGYGFCEFNIGGGNNVKWLGGVAPGTQGYWCSHALAQCARVTLPAGHPRSFGSCESLAARPSPQPATFFPSAACCKSSPSICFSFLIPCIQRDAPSPPSTATRLRQDSRPSTAEMRCASAAA